MLVTTCPECATTFRISEEILKKARGQVRCGRCAHIFDAKQALRVEPETEVRRLDIQPGAGVEPAPRGSSAARPSAGRPTEPRGADAEAEPPRSNAEAKPPRADAKAKARSASVAATTGKARTETTSETASADERKAGTGGESERLIEDEPLAASKPEADTPDPKPTPSESATRSGAAARPASTRTTEADENAEPAPEIGPAAAPDADALSEIDEDLIVPDWLPPSHEPVERRTRFWTAGVVLLALVLAGQLVHFFRADLAALPALGPALVRTYSWLGVELVPRVDLNQYDMVDLTGAAAPATDAQGSLVIETRVRNRGPKVQPFPHVFVRLLDRWEDTIAGRYFSPAEYLVSPESDTSRMSVGRNFDAQFVIVDPGPNATGFELEFCMPAGDGFHCESDEAHN